MPSDKLPPPIWVAKPDELQQLADELVHWKRIAVDTESNSLHAFQEQLCLIQFSTPRTDYLVDPLGLKNLNPLQIIFRTPGIELVFHAAEYDLICLKRDFSITVASLFDTMQAARILGYEKVGLDSMLEIKLGIKLNKKYQKADWGERPLSYEMLNYARLDTHHLLDLRDSLQTELQARGRWDLAQEEFVRLAHGNGNGKGEVPAWQRVKGAQKFTDRQLTILQQLCTWREKQAKQMNRPPFKVIDDKRLIAITQTLPETHKDLTKLGLTARQIHLFGNEILEAVRRGKQTTMVSRPHSLRPNQAFLDRLNVLSEWRKKVGLKTGVESDVILPRNWMNHIAEKNPGNLKELANLMPDSPWRIKEFGEEILAVITAKHSQIEPKFKKIISKS
jgi:ribonuclease D